MLQASWMEAREKGICCAQVAGAELLPTREARISAASAAASERLIAKATADAQARRDAAEAAKRRALAAAALADLRARLGAEHARRPKAERGALRAERADARAAECQLADVQAGLP